MFGKNATYEYTNGDISKVTLGNGDYIDVTRISSTEVELIKYTSDGKYKDIRRMVYSNGKQENIQKDIPFIDYRDWKEVSNGQVQNIGKSGTNLQLYSGNPLDFQGSQYANIILPNTPNIYLIQSFNNTITTNDLSSRGGQSYSIGKNDGTGALLDGLFDFFILRSVNYSATEISLASNNPNAFYDSMVNDTNTLFATDFRGNAGYIADDRNKVVGSELVTNGTFDTDVNGWVSDPVGGTISWENGKLKFTSSAAYQRVIQVIPFVEGTTVALTFDVTDIDSGNFSVYDFSSGSWLFSWATSFCKHTIIFTVSSGVKKLGFYSNRATANTSVYYDNISVKEISAVYPIINYTSTMRTNFTTQPNGLQELLIKRDSLGFYVGATNYLNCNGKGYGDTGWIPSASEEALSIEFIVSKKSIASTIYDKSFGNNVGINGEYITNITNRFAIRFYGYNSAPTAFNEQNCYYCCVTNGVNTFIYQKGVLVATVPYANLTGSAKVALCAGNTNGVDKAKNSSLTLFKVHKKVLTQEEIITNYNNYLAQGLLQ